MAAPTLDLDRLFEELVPTATPPTGARPAPRQGQVAVSPATPVPRHPLADPASPEFRGLATKYGLDPDIMGRVMGQESRFNPRAVSPKGAKGLMQLMDTTAKDYGVTDPFDPDQNVPAGFQYMRNLLMQHGGDYHLALAAYNAGPGAVKEHKGIPPYRETEQYVQKIMGSGVSPTDLTRMFDELAPAPATPRQPTPTQTRYVPGQPVEPSPPAVPPAVAPAAPAAPSLATPAGVPLAEVAPGTQPGRTGTTPFAPAPVGPFAQRPAPLPPEAQGPPTPTRAQLAHSAEATLAREAGLPSPPPRDEPLEEVAPWGVVPLAQGLRQGGAGIAHTVSNLAMLAGKLQGREATEMTAAAAREGWPQKIQAVADDVARYLQVHPDVMADQQRFDEVLFRQIGQAIPTLAVLYGASQLGVGLVPAFAGMAALSAADQGVLASGLAALRAAVFAKLAGVVTALPAWAQIPGMVTLFGGETYLTTGDLKQAAAQGLIGGALVAGARPGAGTPAPTPPPTPTPTPPPGPRLVPTPTPPPTPAPTPAPPPGPGPVPPGIGSGGAANVPPGARPMTPTPVPRVPTPAPQVPAPPEALTIAPLRRVPTVLERTAEQIQRGTEEGALLSWLQRDYEMSPGQAVATLHLVRQQLAEGTVPVATPTPSAAPQTPAPQTPAPQVTPPHTPATSVPRTSAPQESRPAAQPPRPEPVPPQPEPTPLRVLPGGAGMTPEQRTWAYQRPPETVPPRPSGVVPPRPATPAVPGVPARPPGAAVVPTADDWPPEETPPERWQGVGFPLYALGQDVRIWERDMAGELRPDGSRPGPIVARSRAAAFQERIQEAQARYGDSPNEAVQTKLRELQAASHRIDQLMTQEAQRRQDVLEARRAQREAARQAAPGVPPQPLPTEDPLDFTDILGPSRAQVRPELLDALHKAEQLEEHANSLARTNPAQLATLRETLKHTPTVAWRLADQYASDDDPGTQDVITRLRAVAGRLHDMEQRLAAPGTPPQPLTPVAPVPTPTEEVFGAPPQAGTAPTTPVQGITAQGQQEAWDAAMRAQQEATTAQQQTAPDVTPPQPPTHVPPVPSTPKPVPEAVVANSGEVFKTKQNAEGALRWKKGISANTHEVTGSDATGWFIVPKGSAGAPASVPLPTPPAAGERSFYPDGRTIPQDGEEVYQQVRGFGGTPAYIHGVVFRGRQGQLRVRVTGSASLMGGGPQTGKTYRLDTNWTLRGDPLIAQREADAHAKEAAEKAARDRALAQSQAWATEFGIPANPQNPALPRFPDAVQIGDVLEDMHGLRATVTDFDAEYGPLVTYEGEQGTKRTIGHINNWRKTGERATPSPVLPAAPEAEAAPETTPPSEATPREAQQALLTSVETSLRQAETLLRSQPTAPEATAMLAHVRDLEQRLRDQRPVDANIADVRSAYLTQIEGLIPRLGARVLQGGRGAVLPGTPTTQTATPPPGEPSVPEPLKDIPARGIGGSLRNDDFVRYIGEDGTPHYGFVRITGVAKRHRVDLYDVAPDGTISDLGRVAMVPTGDLHRLPKPDPRTGKIPSPVPPTPPGAPAATPTPPAAAPTSGQPPAAFLEGLTPFGPQDLAKLKKPTPKALGLTTADRQWMRAIVPEDRPGWSDGKVLDTKKPTYPNVDAVLKTGNPVPTESVWNPYVDNEAFAVPLTPLARYQTTPARGKKPADEDILFEGGGKIFAFQPKYLAYLKAQHPGFELRGTDPKKAAGVYHQGTLVGLVMPRNLARIEAAYKIVFTPANVRQWLQAAHPEAPPPPLEAEAEPVWREGDRVTLADGRTATVLYSGTATTISPTRGQVGQQDYVYVRLDTGETTDVSPQELTRLPEGSAAQPEAPPEAQAEGPGMAVIRAADQLSTDVNYLLNLVRPSATYDSLKTAARQVQAMYQQLQQVDADPDLAEAMQTSMADLARRLEVRLPIYPQSTAEDRQPILPRRPVATEPPGEAPLTPEQQARKAVQEAFAAEDKAARELAQARAAVMRGPVGTPTELAQLAAKARQAQATLEAATAARMAAETALTAVEEGRQPQPESAAPAPTAAAQPAQQWEVGDRVQRTMAGKVQTGTVERLRHDQGKVAVRWDGESTFYWSDAATLQPVASPAPPAPTEAQSWRVGVKGRGDTTWNYNAQRFATKAEADAWGSDLLGRWGGAQQVESHPSPEAPTHRWDPYKGEAFPLSSSGAAPAPTAAAQPVAPEEAFRRLTVAIGRVLSRGETLHTIRDLQALADTAYGGTRAEGTYDTRDLYDAMEVALNQEVQRIDRTGMAGPEEDSLETAQGVAQFLHQLSNHLPTQTVRTAEQDAMQQFSTPLDYAYAVAWVANLQPTDVVLEPSAGTGNLAGMARLVVGDKVYVNEHATATRRLMALAQQGYQHITTEDAHYLGSILHKRLDPAPTVVLMNPPFSSAPAQAMHTTQVGANHVEEALKLLAPGGRLVAIVGGGMGPETATFKDWFTRIGKSHTIRAVVEVGEDVYRKQGTHFGTRVIIIDKGGSTPQGSILTGVAPTIPDLLAKLEGVRHVRTQIPIPAVPAPERGTPAAAGAGGVQPGAEPAVPTDVVVPEGAEGRPVPARGAPPDRGAGGDVGLETSGGGGVAAGAGGRRPQVRPNAPPGRPRGPQPGGRGARPAGGLSRPTVPGQGGVPAPESPEAAGGPRLEPIRTAVAGFSDAEFEQLWDQAADELKTPTPTPASRPAPPPRTPRASRPAVEPGVPPAPLPPAEAPVTPATPPEAAPSGLRMTEAERQAMRDILEGGVEAESPPYERWLAGVDPAKYMRLKPFMETILERTEAAGGTPLDFFKGLMTEFGAAIKPYAMQFRNDLATQEAIQPPPHDEDVRAPEGDATPEAEQVDLAQALFLPYVLPDLGLPNTQPHRGALVETAAMAAVQSPPITYTPSFPPDVISEGRLSHAQLVAVALAGQAHAKHVPTGARQGILVGDGTGTGKGRIIAGVFYDNWLQGRTKGVWLSKSMENFAQAQGDWEDVTHRDKREVFNLTRPDTPTAQPIKQESGILFLPYDTLKASEMKEGGRSRIDQLLEWLGADYDGVIIMDEAHLLGNNVTSGDPNDPGSQQASQRAIAALQLQAKLPEARLLYLSATSATEVRNLGYLERLGLWGPGTAFATKGDFIAGIESRGVAAMEYVARDLKALGLYVARSLSYADVEYRRIEIPFDEAQIASYDRIASAWRQVTTYIEDALQATGGHGGLQQKRAETVFWGAQQRFFNQLITAMKGPAIIADIETYMQDPDGGAAVIQLTNTNAATQTRKLAQMEEGERLEDLHLSPMQILMEYIEKSFPTQQYVPEPQDDGTIIMVELADSEGRPVPNAEAVRLRDELLDELAMLEADIPPGLLDQVIHHFGVEQVAEITGRKERLVYLENAQGQRVLTRQTKRTARHIRQDLRDFYDDKKRILIFSQKGDTGMDYHAGLKFKNQRQRYHYLGQPGWRSDVTTQGLGRTHRTNQASAPIDILPVTDLPAERRFMSSIARRLDQMGALTRGARQASSNGLFTDRDNLETIYAENALDRLMNDIVNDRNVSIGPDAFQDATGMDPNEHHEMTRFLNRLFMFPVAVQKAIFNDFSVRLDDVIETAVQNGTYQVGMETIRADRITKIREQTLATDADTGAETTYLELKIEHKPDARPWEALQARIQVLEATERGTRFLEYRQNTRSKRVYAVMDTLPQVDRKTGALLPRVRLLGILSEDKRLTTDVQGERWVSVPEASAPALWQAQIDALPMYLSYTEHMITGLLMPHWDKLGTSMQQVQAVVTQEGERILGMILPPSQLVKTLQNFGTTVPGISMKRPSYAPEEALARILQEGSGFRLSNDWTLLRSEIGGAPRVEVQGLSSAEGKQARADGVIFERVGYAPHYFLPTGPTGVEVYQRLLRGKHLAEEYTPQADVVEAEVAPYETASPRASTAAPGTVAAPEPAYAPPFFSAVHRALEAKMPNRAAPAQVKALLQKTPGLKAEEVKWLGILPWLDEQGKTVTKQAVRDFLEENAIEVKPVILGETLPVEWDVNRTGNQWFPYINDQGKDRSFRGFRIEYLRSNDRYLFHTAGGTTEVYATLAEAQAAGAEAIQASRLNVTPTQFAQGSLLTPGADPGSNREVLFTLPPGSPGAPPQPFEGGHYRQPNIVAHLRTNTRTDTEGRRLLFIEEDQSDWRKAGRKEGFGRPEGTAADLVLRPVMTGFGPGYEVTRPDGTYVITVLEKQANTPEEARRIAWETIQRGGVAQGFDIIPSAPFVTTGDWFQLPLKWALRHAAEQGLDGIAWTTGEMQQARYGLGAVVDDLKYDPEIEVLHGYKEGQLVFGPHDVSAEDLPGVIGQANAARLLAQPLAPNREQGGMAHRLTGQEFAVGDEWVLNLYDRMIPQFLNKYGKQWGARVGETQVVLDRDRYAVVNAGGVEYAAFPTREQAEQAIPFYTREYGGMSFAVRDRAENASRVPFLPITNAMRQSVLTEGQALFAPPAGYLARFEGSKVVDEEGALLPVYHGTGAAFAQFDPGLAGSGAGGNLYGPGLYFTDSPAAASEYTKAALPRREVLVRDQPWNAIQRALGHRRLISSSQDITIKQSGTDAAGNPVYTASLVIPPQANVRPAYLNIQRPFDMDTLLRADEAKRLVDRVLPDFGNVKSKRLIDDAAAQGELQGKQLYDILTDVYEKREVNSRLQHAGYDGITHRGDAVTGGEPYQVWIAFRADQVQPVFTPEVTYAQRPGSTPFDRVQAERILADLETSGGRGIRAASRGVVSPGGGPSLPGRSGPAGTRLLGKALASDAYLDALYQDGAAVFVGQRAPTPHDLAVLAQGVRDPRLERLFWILMKGDRVVGVLAISSRLPGSSAAFPTAAYPGRSTTEHLKWLTQQMRQVGADRYYMVHNHPHGDPTPSPADKALTQNVARDLPGFQGHVVINSGAYAVMDAHGKVTKQDLDTGTLWAATGGVDPFLKAPAMEVPHALLTQQIRHTNDIARLAQRVNIPDGYVLAFYRSASADIRGIELLPVSLFTGRTAAARLGSHLKQRQRALGAVETLTYYDGPAATAVETTADALYEVGLVRDHYTPGAERPSMAGRTPSGYGRARPNAPGYLLEQPPRKAS